MAITIMVSVIESILVTQSPLPAIDVIRFDISSLRFRIEFAVSKFKWNVKGPSSLERGIVKRAELDVAFGIAAGRVGIVQRATKDLVREIHTAGNSLISGWFVPSVR